ncbi:MAG TPA: cyclohexa-1,5-dienecarbonyl-CoA hydratase [Candidatus Krumholzibacteria bacterium]|nr:cyclohexa-1,5-dienecarbonyl-CoA hydratase [Candidatus Krumholzibacteria bacterium]
MNPEAARSNTVVRVESLEGGAVRLARLNTPKANVLDRTKIDALTALFEDAGRDPNLKAIIIEGEGPNFSFGASVQEHLPDACGAMLSSFHSLFRAILDASVVTLAAVRGQCLGGGLELAAFCNRVFASEDARLGQPEIQLGVFAPVASAILPDRMGRGAAEDLLLSGRSITAAEALRVGLVDEVVADPGDAALAYARTHLVPRSASSLRLAVKAARYAFAEQFGRNLAALESCYLDDLMNTADAEEGLRAFLEKRTPSWKNR